MTKKSFEDNNVIFVVYPILSVFSFISTNFSRLICLNVLSLLDEDREGQGWVNIFLPLTNPSPPFPKWCLKLLFSEYIFELKLYHYEKMHHLHRHQNYSQGNTNLVTVIIPVTGVYSNNGHL